MKMGFDLDGVLCDIDVTVLHLMHKLPPEEEELAEVYYYKERKPLLNPKFLMNEDDTYCIITGRHNKLREVTHDWCKRFLPDVKEVYVVGGDPWYYYKAAKHADPKIWREYAENSVMAKVHMIRSLDLDFYIDDSPSNVRRLREELPKVTVLQYGGRL